MKKETDDNLRNLKGEMISSFKEMKKETDYNFKNLKLELASIVNELKKENNVKLNSLKNEISRSKNDVDNLILLVNEIKKGTDDNEITGISKAIFNDLMKSERIPEIVTEPQYEIVTSTISNEPQ